MREQLERITAQDRQLQQRGTRTQCRATVVLLCSGSDSEEGVGVHEAPGVMRLPEPYFVGARCIDIKGHGGRTSTQLRMLVVKVLEWLTQVPVCVVLVDTISIHKHLPIRSTVALAQT